MNDAVKEREDAAALEDREKARSSREGKNASESHEDRPELNRIMEENRKLKEQLASQQEEHEEYKTGLEERLAELESKNNPSRKDEREIGDIESELRALDANPKAKVWDERIKRNSDNVAQKKITKLDYDMALEWVEETSESLSNDDPYADPKKLEKAIVKKLQDGRWSDRPLRVRVKKAWKEMRGEAEKSRADEDARKKSIERKEEGGLSPLDRKPSSFVDLAKKGDFSSALDAIYDKQVKEQRRLEER